MILRVTLCLQLFLLLLISISNTIRQGLRLASALMQVAAHKHLQMLNDLRNALATRQLLLHYQAIADLATGHIHKAEALIRWQHPSKGMISPADFIAIAENSGLIIEIGDWV